MSIDPISAGLSLATEVFKWLNTPESVKLIKEVTKLQLEIQEESEKGYYSDDAKIEALEARCSILMNAAKSQIEIMKTKQ